MKKFLKILGVIVLMLVVYSALQGLFTFVALLGYMIYAFCTGELNTEILQDPAALMNNSAYADYAVDAMAWGLFLSAATMLLFIHLTKLFPLRKSLFTSIEIRPLLWSTALVFSSMFALNTFVQWFPLENMLEDQFMALSHTLLGAFTISVLAPLLEEVMFRGAIQGYIMRRVRSPWLAIVIASLVFGIFHLNPVQVVYATMLGIIFGWMYYRTGSLMSVIVGHVLNNTIATVTTLLFGNEDAFEAIAPDMSVWELIASQVAVFILFAALSVFFAIKLHRSLPPAPVPWHESDEPDCASGEMMTDCA